VIQHWLIIGSKRNWEVAFDSNNIWGLKPFRELEALWNMLRVGDGLLFYVSKPVHGVVGTGRVVTKFRQTTPLWPEETARNQVIWPLRFEFDVEYCLPPDLWKTRRYTSHDLQMVARMVFQCYPVEEVNAARSALGLQPVAETLAFPQANVPVSVEATSVDHDTTKVHLAEIGRIQGYVADEEYPLESTKLDVVWRRIQRSVPTFVFEVQVGGDIYHAMAKLKHAYDLWNSRIFLVAAIREKSKYDELLAGTFHELESQMHFIDIGMVDELLKKKRDYKDLEKTLGILSV